MRQLIGWLIFGFIILIINYVLGLVGKRLSKKMNKIESELNENDFVMRPMKWIRVSGFLVGAIALGFAALVFIYTLISENLGMAIGMVAIFVLPSVIPILLVIAIPPFRNKIIIKENIITHYRFLRKIVQLTFDDIQTVRFDEAGDTRYYDINDKEIRLGSPLWIGYGLLIKRLIYLGKLPLYLPPSLFKNKKQNKEYLNILTSLMKFLVEHDLVIWCSFDENRLIENDFKLYYADLTKKGQQLYKSEVMDKWIDFALKGGDITDFSLLQNGLMEIEYC